LSVQGLTLPTSDLTLHDGSLTVPGAGLTLSAGGQTGRVVDLRQPDVITMPLGFDELGVHRTAAVAAPPHGGGKW
jgi:hypothetical protein